MNGKEILRESKAIILHDDLFCDVLYYFKLGKLGEFEKKFGEKIKNVKGIVGAKYTPNSRLKFAAEDLLKCFSVKLNFNGIKIYKHIEGLDNITINDLLRLKDVFSLSLTWVRRNEYACGVGENGISGKSGITKKGFEVLEYCKEKNIAVCLSHLNDNGVIDVLKTKNKVFASHSNLRSVFNSPRNLPEKFAKKIADSGGVIGLNTYKPFIAKENFFEKFVFHILYAINVCGENAVSLGLDLCDNRTFSSPPNNDLISSYDDISLIVDALINAKVNISVIEKLLYKNAERFLTEN